MAKGSAMGLWRGKKGSTVFYTLKNSNNGQRQAMRERVYEISNPKTSQQASQRLKMLPAQRVYSVLKPILRRSWQGVKYGGDGYREFMKYAMSMLSGFPYVTKDETRIVPGNYMISKGVLQSVEVRTIPTSAEGDTFTVNLNGATGDLDTVGDLSSVLVSSRNSNNVQLEEGMQVTFIWVTSNQQTEPGGYYSWHYESVVINESDTTPLSDALPHIVEFGIDTNDNGALSITVSAPYVIAAAVVISKLNGSTYERSTSYLKCNDNFLAYWEGAARVQESRVSYMGSAGAQSTDWPVQPEEEGEVTAPALYTLSGLTGDKASCNGKKVWVRKNASDELVAVYAYPAGEEIESDALVQENGQALTYEVSMNEVALKPSDVTALASLPIIRTTTVPTA